MLHVGVSLFLQVTISNSSISDTVKYGRLFYSTVMLATIAVAVANAAGAYTTTEMFVSAAIVDIAWAGMAMQYLKSR